MKLKINEKIKFVIYLAAFLMCYFMPLGKLRVIGPLFEAFALIKWYAQEHVMLCLIPAFFIAGAVSVFISKEAVIKYFGYRANKALAYGVASISGTILAVCSCTVLPLFSGIYKRGAGLGPATAFLYSGPAINVLAIIMTARILGWQLGVARALGAIIFSIVVGLLMHLIFLKEERMRHGEGDLQISAEKKTRPLWQNGVYFFAMVGILIFANWTGSEGGETGLWAQIYSIKWIITGAFAALLGYMAVNWFSKQENSDWVQASWGFAKQILPLLLIGVFVAGFLLGRPHQAGVIPVGIIERAVGGNSIISNFLASILGAFMYFATLTEVPILQGLIGAGMGKGPALALLLAGPALSLPNMLVIRGVLGTMKTLTYVFLVVVMATISGMIFGYLV